MPAQLTRDEITLVNKVYGKFQNNEHLTSQEYMSFRKLWPALVVDNVFNSRVYALDKYLVREYCWLENGIQVKKQNPKWVSYNKIRENRESILELLIEGKVRGYESDIDKLQGIRKEVERNRNLTYHQYESLRNVTKKLIEDKDIQKLKEVAKGYVNVTFQELEFYQKNQHARLEAKYKARIQAQEKERAEIIEVKPRVSFFKGLFSRVKAAVF